MAPRFFGLGTGRRTSIGARNVRIINRADIQFGPSDSPVALNYIITRIISQHETDGLMAEINLKERKKKRNR